MSIPLQHVLTATLTALPAAKLCIAYSGGPDSTALLHALAQLPEARDRGLRALHVDHGLHADSRRWAQRCEAFCKSLGVPLRIVQVEVVDTRGEGIEAAARRARRDAFADDLRDGEWLALAHHRNDQVETVLLKLLRGAGPEGLGGMRVLRPFARGFLWRPLLDVPRTELHQYIMAYGLPCIDDPANADPRFSRNVMRREILPLIAQHWPHADTSILHAARLCRSASDYLDTAAENAFQPCKRSVNSLDAAGWLALPDAIRAPVLDRWLRERGLPTPADTQRRELARQATDAAKDATPCVAWPGTEVRIWDGRLHAMPPLEPLPEQWQADWDGAPLRLPADCGTLQMEPNGTGSPPALQTHFHPPLNVRLRRGGEHLKPVGDAHTRELRDLFQQARIPPWLRERCPLIFEHDTLIAIAGLWVSADGKTIFDAHNVRPRWTRAACQASF